MLPALSRYLSSTRTAKSHPSFQFFLQRFLYGLKWDTEVKQIGLTPLTESQFADFQARFAAAENDTNAAHDLFIFYRGNEWPACEIPAPCTFAPGVFSCNAPDGPAIVTYLDKEAYFYYKFAMIKGATTIDIGDRDGMWLLRK